MSKEKTPRSNKAWNANEYRTVKLLFANGYIREEVSRFTGRPVASLTVTLSDLGTSRDELVAARGLTKQELMNRAPLPEYMSSHAYQPLEHFGLHLYLTKAEAAVAAAAAEHRLKLDELAHQNQLAADSDFEEVDISDKPGITDAMRGVPSDVTTGKGEQAAMNVRANAVLSAIDVARKPAEEEEGRLVPRGPFPALGDGQTAEVEEGKSASLVTE